MLRRRSRDRRLVSSFGRTVPGARDARRSCGLDHGEFEKQRGSVPENYRGFSYESAQLAHPEFFAPTNKSLIEFFRRLTKHGVLRMGGNTSEYTVWSPDGSSLGAPATAAVGPDASGPNSGGPRRLTASGPGEYDGGAACGSRSLFGWRVGRRAGRTIKGSSRTVHRGFAGGKRGACLFDLTLGVISAVTFFVLIPKHGDICAGCEREAR